MFVNVYSLVGGNVALVVNNNGISAEGLTR